MQQRSDFPQAIKLPGVMARKANTRQKEKKPCTEIERIERFNASLLKLLLYCQEKIFDGMCEEYKSFPKFCNNQ
jgi:hypothetical protein